MTRRIYLRREDEACASRRRAKPLAMSGSITLLHTTRIGTNSKQRPSRDIYYKLSGAYLERINRRGKTMRQLTGAIQVSIIHIAIIVLIAHLCVVGHYFPKRSPSQELTIA